MSALALAVLAVPLALQAVALLRRPAPERCVLGVDLGSGEDRTAFAIGRVENGVLIITDHVFVDCRDFDTMGLRLRHDDRARRHNEAVASRGMYGSAADA